MKWRTYPAYRDSGVVWLGEIPEHWPVTRLKRIVSICNGQDYKEFEAQDGAYPVIGSGGEFSRARAALFNGESVLLGRKGTIDKPLYVDGPFWVVDTMFYTKIYPQAFPKFVYYSALTIPFEMYSTNTALPSMTGENLSFHVTTAPDYTEQKAIAAFLDRETSRIDELIAKKQRQIELLQEKRSALISHVVTKGLDPDVKMKDSGVEWLGEIPEHWEIRRLKYISPKQTVGLVINPSSYVNPEGEVPFFFGADVSRGEIHSQNARRITKESNKLLWQSMLRTDDLVTVRVGYPGMTAVVPPELDKSNCASMMIIRRSPSFISQWLCHVMNSDVGKAQIEIVQYGAAQKQFNISHAIEFRLPFPPKEEQGKIVKVLDSMTSKTLIILDQIVKSIDLLREYRTALISAAVTGKIDVRKEVPAS